MAAARQPHAFSADGFLLARGLVPASLLHAMSLLMHTHAMRIMAGLGKRPIRIGSRDGYRELVQRSPGRFDVPMSEPDLAPLWGERGSIAPEVPWLGLVRAALGPAAQPSFCGAVFSRPGSPAQQWHIDSPHEAAEHRPAHAVNVLVALADISREAGPTEVAPGSHVRTNHLQRPWLDRDSLLYQSAIEVTPAALEDPHSAQPASAPATFVQPMLAGDCLIFDDRILHRGLANDSRHERWVAYFSYRRPRPGLDGIVDTHFEASRSLFD